MANQTSLLGTVIHVGDIVGVHHKFKDKDKERTQVFSGVVIRIRGKGSNKTFTVRRIASGGIGVERIWPVESPAITKVVVKKRGKVRRAKLYYLRKRIGKQATKVKTVQEKKVSERPKVDEKKKPGKPRRKSSPEVSKE